MSADRHSIDLATAIDLTTRWRKHHPDALKGGMFPRASFERLLRDPEAAGIRIYLALRDGGHERRWQGHHPEGRGSERGRRGDGV